MKYSLNIEMEQAELNDILGTVSHIVTLLCGAGTTENASKAVDDVVESDSFQAVTPSTSGTGEADVLVVRESRQPDTPEAYGDPLEFRVAPAITEDDLLKAHAAFHDFFCAWCSPFSSDLPPGDFSYPNRGQLFNAVAGSVHEGRIKQYIAHWGTVNMAVYVWLSQCTFGPEQFSGEDLASPKEELADRISGSFAQLASVYMPELNVLYDISPKWRKSIPKEN
jgi:hypothetical protein